MYFAEFFVVLLLALVGVQSRSVIHDVPEPHIDFSQLSQIFNAGGDHDTEAGRREFAGRVLQSVYPGLRVRRQAGSISTNPDGSANINARVPLAGNENHAVSALAGVSGLAGGKYGAATGGFAYDNVNGHGATLTAQHIPDFGDRLTAAAKVNLVNTQDHNLAANAFLTKTMPANPAIPNFNTKGASVDYLYNNKVGASVGVANTDLFKKTDYSAMGNVNLFRDRTSSLDLNAGYSKSVSPYIPSSKWQPSGGITWTKFW